MMRPFDYIYGVGSLIAMVVSWGHHHSLLLSVFHGVCSWFYLAIIYLPIKGVT
jgi:hypothetical protein